MQANLLRALPLLLLLLLSLALALGLFKDDPAKRDQRLVGQKIAPFEVPTLGYPGTKFSPKTWQDRVVVVNVFASWCEPCRAEHPVLMNLAKTGKVLVYGIAWRDKAEKIQDWLTQGGNPYQLIGIDQFGRSTVPLALSGVPETYVIDRDGVVRYHHASAITDEIVNTSILPLVKQLSQSNAPAR